MTHNTIYGHHVKATISVSLTISIIIRVPAVVMISDTPSVSIARVMGVITLPVLTGHPMLSFTSVPNVSVTVLDEAHNTANSWPEGVPVGE